MSRPVGIIAKINLSEENYKRYVRKIAADLLAVSIFERLQFNYDNDYYVFRYLKKENALYAFFYFNHGNSEYLLKHPLLTMLQNIKDWLDDDSTGYLLATLDSINSIQNNDLVYAAIIHQQAFRTHQFSEAETRAIGKDAHRYFFKYTETDFPLAFERSRMVDKTIRAKVQKLQTAYILQNLKNNLHTAVVEKPIELFSEYFYNGKKFYTVKKPLTVIDNVNLQALQQTTYGLCDDKSIIVGNVHLRTDPKKFRMHQKGETILYSSAEAVYNEKLERYPNSDGLTFKLKNEYVSEDKHHIYFCGVQLFKQEVGDYKICNAGYFYSRILLYSALLVRTPWHVFTTIDAPTFAIINPDVGETLKNTSTSYRGCFVAHCRDKHGELIIHDYDIYDKQLPQVERINSVKEYLEKARAILKKKYSKKKSPEKIETYPDFFEGDDINAKFEELSCWLAADFEKKYVYWQYDESFYIRLNNHFCACFQLYQKTKDYAYLQIGIEQYEKVAATCFINPFIFHHAACLYTKLGDTEKALQSVAAALSYGYKRMDLIWDDNDLAAIACEPDFIALKMYYEQIRGFYPLINTRVIDKVAQIPDEYNKSKIAALIVSRFIFPDEDWFSHAGNIEKEQIHLVELKQKQSWLMNYALQHMTISYDSTYKIHQNSSFLNAKTHFFALNYFFPKAHLWYGHIEFSFCIAIAEKIKSLLQKNNAENDVIRKKIAASEINKILEIV